jgi:hypothetical protein
MHCFGVRRGKWTTAGKNRALGHILKSHLFSVFGLLADKMGKPNTFTQDRTYQIGKTSTAPHARTIHGVKTRYKALRRRLLASSTRTEISVHEEPQEDNDWDRNADHPKD